MYELNKDFSRSARVVRAAGVVWGAHVSGGSPWPFPCGNDLHICIRWNQVAEFAMMESTEKMKMSG